MEVQLKSAREMFEELGYEKIQEDANWLIYSFNKVFKIMFYKPQQDFKIECLDNIYNTIDMEELKAINKQVEELGWND